MTIPGRRSCSFRERQDCDRQEWERLELGGFLGWSLGGRLAANRVVAPYHRQRSGGPDNKMVAASSPVEPLECITSIAGQQLRT
ncbi:Hypothetical protein NTJ_06068 [Nesidiocoris tenuis]|uniref:Uncharacterized protein n=1 Tax=Nesidiocoris tenuis TaxID=355587 RepID=A0ABN7APB0_9HEMI|nr:Hypothetical protein NTJ_06068 [Nesidiocoris tenuis]